jgi:hypothetical protein
MFGLWLTAGTVWQPRLAALVPASMAIVLLTRFWKRCRLAKYSLMRLGIRMVRSWHGYFKRPAIVEALHLLGIGAVLLLMAGLVSGVYKDVRTGMTPVFAIFAVAGICEITVQAKRILKQAWAKTAGKVISLSLGGILTAVTVSMAKQTVHSLAHIDPKYMAEFTAVVVAGMLPLVYLGVAGALLLLWAVIQILVVVVLFASGMFTQAMPWIGNCVQNRARLLWYRICKGRRPSGGAMPVTSFMPQHEVSLVGSVISKFAVVGMLAQVVDDVSAEVPRATPLLAKTMVQLEYRPASSCRNIDARLAVVYMDDGYVSVASFRDGRYHFRVEKCEYGGEN